MRRHQAIGAVLSAILFLAASLHAAKFQKNFEKPADWDETLYDWKIDASLPGGIRLLKTELVADEMGVTTGNMKEEVFGKTWIKKEFLLDAVQADSAVLLIHMNAYEIDEFNKKGGFLWIDVNGHPVRLVIDVARMLTGGWVRCDISPGFLVPGLNAVVIRNESPVPFPTSVEASRIPNRSAKSPDGGKTWDYHHLGKEGFIDGEYLIRLRLGRYASSAEIKSDFIELAALATDGAVKPAVRLKDFSLEAEKDLPAGTGISLEVRGGTTPAYDSGTWSPWLPAQGGAVRDFKDWRFVQWRAELRTKNRQQTPVLKKLVVRADLDVVHAAAKDIKVLADKNQKIVRGYYEFVHQKASEPRLEVLRKRYRLEEIVGHCANEFEQFRVLAFWMRGIWRDGWGKQSNLELHTPWDALVSLELTPQYKASGMCVIYSNTFVQTALALGLTARGVILDHHFVSEVWSNDYRKWVTFDIASSYDSIRPDFHIKDGVPLSSLETHKLARAGMKGEVWVQPAGPHSKINGLDQKKEKLLGPDEWEPRMGIPFRNNYLTSWLPGELEHGFIQYHYDGYLWWKDTPIPKYEEYTYQSSHPRDFYWTINQAQIFLYATDDPSKLNVVLDTVTPNFESFFVRVDGGEWKASGADFAWALHNGKNSLEARPVNVFKREGIISVIEVER